MARAEEELLRTVFRAALASRAFLDWMDEAAERLAPERSAELASRTERSHGGPLRAARAGLDGASAPSDLGPFTERFLEGFAHAERCFGLFSTFPEAPPPERIPRILESLHERARAEECFYSLRHVLPPFADRWPSPPRKDDGRASREDAESPTGVVHVSRGGHHGGFSLYVPEYYSPDREWPLVVALHGGSGNGADFLWTWAREAKRFGHLLVAPTARGDTWGEIDDRGLLEILSWIGRRYRLATGRILLTGLSDGATFTLLYGLLHPEIYRALAPLCGVLHPANEALGNLGRRAACRSISFTARSTSCFRSAPRVSRVTCFPPPGRRSSTASSRSSRTRIHAPRTSEFSGGSSRFLSLDPPPSSRQKKRGTNFGRTRP